MILFQDEICILTIFFLQRSNKADLRLLEDMGITPGPATRQKRVSLKSVALGVIATIRMQKKSAAWAGHRRVQESLLKKLEGMKGSKK